MPARNCGNCTACCLTHAVAEVKKPLAQWCRHCNIGKGCRIYSSRPNDCKLFRCEWLKGFGSECFRPDRTGVVLDFVSGTKVGQLLQVWEAREGCLATIEIWELTRELLHAGAFVCHLYLRGKKLLFVPSGITLTKEMEESILKEEIELTYFPILGL
ncbi:MAG: hypothetical protein RB292_04645 [Patescibacteria group bacterium]|nr:hypothetical protein [Patescibacteria group bacterium]